MSNIRQSIILREDLQLPRGLSEAQVAHIHAKRVNELLLGLALPNGSPNNMQDFLARRFCLPIEDLISWLKTPYIFVHGVPNKEVLSYFCKLADEKMIPYTPWIDTVEIKVSDTQKIVIEDVTIGIALGPFESDKIRSIIGDLPLLREKN